VVVWLNPIIAKPKINLFENPIPPTYGYYELLAPLGKGKSTRLPMRLAGNHKRVLLIEPCVTLARAVGERIGFTTQAGGVIESRMGRSKVVTAGSVCKLLQSRASDLAEYDIILLDESHVEHVDVITLKRWFMENAISCHLKVVGMSATFPGRTDRTSNYLITDIKVITLIDLNKITKHEY
jgi:hypothetical protein